MITAASNTPANVAVIVVNYNTTSLLRNCLLSVAAAARYAATSVAVWVVDNASKDGSAEHGCNASFPMST